MDGASFTLNIVTPAGMFTREVRHVRLRDGSGFFGVMKGHADFLTVLVPSLCYYRDKEGREVFMAVDEGILTVRDGTATLVSREVFESEDAGKLSEIIDSAFRDRRKSEEALREMLVDIEKSFMEKTVGFLKGAT